MVHYKTACCQAKHDDPDPDDAIHFVNITCPECREFLGIRSLEVAENLKKEKIEELLEGVAKEILEII
ncbi:MAG: hypothetical protein KGJ09_09710 [Candidatus Omnitrophica bacterium]|nr:hypothetical protein [Candidatus Omnitrophota bacterium]MDE2215384.1 hypothetical protein [Candidatus Omnitrophota bacterium]